MSSFKQIYKYTTWNLKVIFSPIPHSSHLCFHYTLSLIVIHASDLPSIFLMLPLTILSTKSSPPSLHIATNNLVHNPLSPTNISKAQPNT